MRKREINMKKMNKKVSRAVLAVGASGVIALSVATTAVIMNSHKIIKGDKLASKTVMLDGLSKTKASDFTSNEKPPSEIVSYLDDDKEEILSISGKADQAFGTITTTIVYKALNGVKRTEKIIFGGYLKVSIISNGGKRFATLTLIGSGRVISPLSKTLYIEKLKSIKIPTKLVFPGITSLLAFDNYQIPTDTELDTYSIKQIKIAIEKAKHAKEVNKFYNNAITLKRKLVTNKKEYLKHLIQNLRNIHIESEYLSTESQTVTPGYPSYKAPILNGATAQQVEKFINKKRKVKEAAFIYNFRLKEADKAAIILAEYIKTLNEVLTMEKQLFKSITIESKYISTHSQTVTQEYPDYKEPLLTQITSLNIDKLTEHKQNAQIKAHNYNIKLKEADLNAYKHDLGEITLPEKLVWEGAITSLVFDKYQIPTNLDG